MTPRPAQQHGTSRTDTRAGRHNWELARGDIQAFGESKSLGAWAQDPRCPVTKAVLRGRLALGWDPEDAITRRKNQEPPLLFSHFGRSLTFRGWAKQSGIPYQTLYTRVFTNGQRFKDALLQGPDDLKFAVPVTAFGETKPLHRWALDTRANCTAATLRQRLEANWPAESAIAEKPTPTAARSSGTRTRDAPGRRTPDALTLRIAAGQLRPGDTILTAEHDPASGTHTLTVRRAYGPPPPAPPAPPPTSRTRPGRDPQ